MIRNARNRFHALAFAFLFLVSPSVKADQWSDLAETILGSSEVQGGLIVHLACGRGDLTASLPINDRFIVQGLDRDRAAIQTARELIQSRGLYGQVSARHWDSRQLPYGDNLVNLMVVDHGSPAVRDEIQRVLCPRGVAVTLDDQHTIVEVYRKPVPGNIDEWTHYLHDASNNAVAEDDRVGPPRHLQWKSGPMWSRSHEFSSSVQALISAKGRLIGVFDEGIVGQPRGVPAFWTLIARDAFNGIQLWRIPCDRINPQALTAVGDKVYVTLKSLGPLCILDAATGEELHVCEGSGKVNEIAVYSDRLILSTILPDAQGKPTPHLAVADPEDGHLIWKQPVEAVAPNGLVAGDGRICYFDGHELVCLSLNDGKPLWRTVVSGRSKGYAVLYEGAVFLTGGSTRAFSLDTGELLWTGPDASPHARNPPGLFGAKGLIWRAWGDVDPRSFVWQHREETRNGYDPRTGEVRKTQTAARLVTAGHHIRCYPPKATHRYLLLNKRGVEFFDLEGTEHMRANWTRAACGFGMLPANGFLYTPPSQCFCYQGVLLTGMNALSSTREIPQGQTAQKDQSPRLQPGPAYGSASMSSTDKDTAEPSDWPTYRGDIFRSGTTDASLPAELARVWETSLCAPAFGSVGSSETIADGGTVVHLKSADATVYGQGAQKREDTIVGWRGKDTYITWEPLIDRQGTHTVWISQSNQGPGGSEFELAVGEQKLRGEIHHTDSWDQYVWVRVGEIEIPKAGIYRVSVKPIKQVDGRLGNVAGVSIGGSTPPTGPSAPPSLRERPRGGLTPPVAAEGRVFVAEPDAHAVHAVSAEDGSSLWTFTADGRVDSPPTLYRGLCLFGSTDGFVYCLSAVDGRLVWRFRAAPEERQLCIMGQVESAWPVHGSVLVRDDKVYCTAGRSSYLDGGIRLYALDPCTGEIVFETRFASPEPDVATYGGRPFDMEGSRSDLLVAGENDIYLFQNRFNASLTPQPMPRITKLGDRQGESHLMTTDGFLDKTWFNRTYWMNSERWPGYYFTYRAPKSGQILVFDDSMTYALKVYTERRGHSPEFEPGTGYLLLADRNSTKPVLDVMDIGAEKGRGYSRTELPAWSRRIPIRAHGLLGARNHLYVAGPPDLTPQEGAYEAMLGKRGAVFHIISKADGSTLEEFEMDEVPVFDGLIAMDNRLFMSTMDGTLICFGAKN